MKKNPAYLGIFTAVSMILGYLESLLPLFYGIPGVKLGLANSMSLTVLYLFGGSAAFLVSSIRILLTGFLFGNLFSVAYSLAGGLLSLAVMYVLKRTGSFSAIGISAAGGIAHNIGQICIAILLVENISLLYYLPVLLASGLVTGVAVGFLTSELLKRLPERL